MKFIALAYPEGSLIFADHLFSKNIYLRSLVAYAIIISSFYRS